MNQTEMLHAMCQEVLSEADVKAVCKARRLPHQAVSSRSLLESLLVSDAGVDDAMAALEPPEIALLHLLKAIGKPVDVTFFHRLDPAGKKPAYATFTQRFQGVFAKVKERLVRRGLLLMALAPEGWPKKTNMERWRFALPELFVHHLPPLVGSAKPLDGEAQWQSDVVRKKLQTATGRPAASETVGDKLEIADRELRLGGEPFRAERLLAWQRQGWQAEISPAKRRKADEPYTLLPVEAAVHILGGLEDGTWADVDALSTPLEIFCGAEVESRALCESGWRWGCLARQESEGTKWYRLAPQPSAADVSPDEYLNVLADGSIAVDLDAVPLESLERLVRISDQAPGRGGRPVVLLAPNLVKLGRAAEAIASLDVADWLQKNSPAFRQAIETVRDRRGKTIVHENLAVARVGDLSLKVALEKALGDRLVALGDDAVAFPLEAVAEVQRIVAKSGHVVKEASYRED